MKQTVTMKPVFDEVTTDGEKAAVTTVMAIDEIQKLFEEDRKFSKPFNSII